MRDLSLVSTKMGLCSEPCSLPAPSCTNQSSSVEGGNVKLERARRNWGITYSRSCCFCYTSTLCTERAKGNKIALEKHWGKKEYWRILRIMRTSMKLFAFLWSFLPKDFTVLAEHKLNLVECSPVGQGNLGTMKWLALGHLQYLWQSQTCICMTWLCGFNLAMGPVVSGRASRSDKTFCLRKMEL